MTTSKHAISTVLLITLLAIGFALASLDTNDLDEICSTNNAVLKRISGTWTCHQQSNMTENIHLTSPNGSTYECSVNNTGGINCE